MAGHHVPSQQANRDNNMYYPHTSLSQSYNPVQRVPVSRFSLSHSPLAFTLVYHFEGPSCSWR